MNNNSIIVENAYQIPLGESMVIQSYAKKILLVRLENGFYAIDYICTHEAEPLNSGSIENNIIECSKHGARFDIKTGAVLAFPAVKPLRTYLVDEKENKVIIYLE